MTFAFKSGKLCAALAVESEKPTQGHPRDVRCDGVFHWRICFLWLMLVSVIGIAPLFPSAARAQSPELSMRDFSSGQIKKGVRSIGFGGDGATWGNYGLVWKDAGTAIVDGSDTQYTNGNDFHWAAAGLTSPALWNDLAIYAIALTEDANGVRFHATSPGLGLTPVWLRGNGSDQALFTKIAMPFDHGISAGILLAYETSRFDAVNTANSAQSVRYESLWRPSGGFGVAWQPNKTLLVGIRALLNNDLERRIDPVRTTTGMAQLAEYRAGGSVSPWDGALLDMGVTHLDRQNDVNATHSVADYPNLGFEQALFDRHLTLRAGLDETSPTVGMSLKFAPFNLDAAYVRNMAIARVGDLFGTDSNSFIMTLTVDYRALSASH